MKKEILITLVVVVVVIGIVLVRTMKLNSVSSPSQTTSQTRDKNPETDLLVDAAVWYPSAPWSVPAKATNTTTYGDLQGYGITATVTQPKPTLDHFEDVNALKAKGFVPSSNLLADGPGSSSWGYVKTQGSQKQIMNFSYKATPTNTNPNEPLQFNCPCKVTVNVFVSIPF